MKIKVPQRCYSVVKLYEEVAKKMGHANTNGLMFDCRHINVAPNIQDGFYAYYTELAKITDPQASETDVRTEITMILAIGGPKVDENLADDEVEVFDGFIC